ncbi:OLC1v1021836C1 [Oldenlandia corymbosa var. corymbosa]|uniref:OLC1v1021836C1 n=1 Tax=Oldenlandia corymbosa var. corymbosa TaxID=529605 RepID=A0AAV1BWK0_OLDCO|nr:OLC1v1021836C1 [Oldenlandia corymbosa var. corymbosa]
MANINFTYYSLLLHLFFLPFITSSASIHDLLISQGLPAGLFPKDVVKSYKVDDYGHLEVYLDKPCVAKFETRVFFDTVVRANLTYGGLTNMQGLSQEELFLWLPVKDIIVYDPSSGLILFDIGLAHKQMSLSQFEDPPACNPQGELEEKNIRRVQGAQAQR